MADILPTAKSIIVSFGLYDEVAETFEPWVENYTASVLDSCSNYQIIITWLNSLGAWEYWLFQGNTSYGYDVEESQLADRSSFENWDANFTQAETERFFADVKARIERTIRANTLTQNQAQALGSIVYSIHAQEFLPNGLKQTVLFEKRSRVVRTEQEKLIDLEFKISNTQRIAIQSQ